MSRGQRISSLCELLPGLTDKNIFEQRSVECCKCVGHRMNLPGCFPFSVSVLMVAHLASCLYAIKSIFGTVPSLSATRLNFSAACLVEIDCDCWSDNAVKEMISLLEEI